MGNVVFPCLQLKIRVSITMEERTLDIGAHLAVSAIMGQELINETCPPCVAPKCSFLEPVPTHNKVFTRLCWNVHTFVQCSYFLIVFFLKRRIIHGNFCGTPWDASVHFCPLRYMGTACSPGLCLAAWDPWDRDQGAVFSLGSCSCHRVLLWRQDTHLLQDPCMASILIRKLLLVKGLNYGLNRLTWREGWK